MNSKIIILFASIALSGAISRATEDKTGANSPVSVTFDHPENFTDVSYRFQSDAASSPYLPQLKSYIETRAQRFLQPGQKLSVNFTDIDLAGDFEPWRGPSAQDVRVIKAIYIPRLKFDYSLTDAAGAVVKQGHANLTDLNFQTDTPAAVNLDEPLRYEKRLLDDWFHDQLKQAKKK